MSKYPLIKKMGLQLYVWGEHFKMPQGQTKYPSGNSCVSADDLERKLHKLVNAGKLTLPEPDTAESLLREFVEIKTDQYPTAGRLDGLLDRVRKLLRESK